MPQHSSTPEIRTADGNELVRNETIHFVSRPMPVTKADGTVDVLMLKVDSFEGRGDTHLGRRIGFVKG
jgi:hypothetical protein